VGQFFETQCIFLKVSSTVLKLKNKVLSFLELMLVKYSEEIYSAK